MEPTPHEVHCDCDILPVYTYFDPVRGISQKLRPFTERVTTSKWRELFCCEICGTFWRVDIAGKFRQQFVWKVGEYREDWAIMDFVNQEKELLLQRRGGEIDEVCIWAGCGKKRVKNNAFCIDHLYAAGFRR